MGIRNWGLGISDKYILIFTLSNFSLDSNPIFRHFLPTAYCLLPTAYCLLPTAYCLLPTAQKYNILNFIISLPVIIFCWTIAIWSGEPIRSDRVPDAQNLLYALKDSISDLQEIYDLRDAGKLEDALNNLSGYLRIKTADRYYFDWKIFPERFDEYRDLYPDKRADHLKLARLQMDLYAPETHWILPFRNLRGEEVSAYELRHLARQQKSSDMALAYYFEDKNQLYLDYFVRQVADLNRAFGEKAYDDAGNGIYEVYRCGRRVQNWMFCHHAYLSSPAYTTERQLLLIRTLLHHGAQLYERSKKMRYGNHHTRGLVALFEIAVIFPEFSLSQIWREHAINGLVWHLTREVNADGFQFERSVHYHKGDIENYFRVFQLAKINGISLPEIYEKQFRKLFESLVKLAQPNRRLPVLQDDTDKPFAVNNSMDEVMILGTIVFNDPEFKYFSGDQISAAVYWLLRKEKLETTQDLNPKVPEIRSCELPETGYYIMRNGWDSSAVYLTISAGLSEVKPDHQHGDMLGVVGYAYGHEILPNYQVQYNSKHYPFYKNSWVKNIALVDNQVLGRGWKQNEGKSGFGKWEDLPETKIISWNKMSLFDHFIGTHSGFDSLNVTYYREIIFFHEGFWLFIDHFKSETKHTYQQVWQGEYGLIETNLWQKQYPDGSGLNVVQLGFSDFSSRKMRFRDKSNIIIEGRAQKDFQFITLLVPFPKTGERLSGRNGKDIYQIGEWRIQAVTADKYENRTWKAEENKQGCIYINAKDYENGLVQLHFNESTNFALFGNKLQYLGLSSQHLISAPRLKPEEDTSDQWFSEFEVKPGGIYLISQEQ